MMRFRQSITLFFGSYKCIFALQAQFFILITYFYLFQLRSPSLNVGYQNHTQVQLSYITVLYSGIKIPVRNLYFSPETTYNCFVFSPSHLHCC